MSLLGRIFGSRKDVSRVVDGAVNGLDAIVFTEEERSHANAELRDWYIKYLEATQPQNLARRLIAIMVTAMWMWLIVLAVLVYPIRESYSAFVFEVMRDLVVIPFGAIITFYFTTHAIRAWRADKDKKK